MPESRAAKSIRESFQSGRPLTYVHSPEEQRVSRVLEEVSRGAPDSQPLPLWTWSITEGCAAAAATAEPGAETARGALDFIVAYQRPGHLPPQGLSRAAARIRRGPAPPARRLRKLPRPAASSSSSRLAGAVPARRDRAQRPVPGTAAARPGGAGGIPARRNAAEPAGEAPRGSAAAGGARAARAHARRIALRPAPRAGRRPAAWEPNRCRPCSKRSGCW